MKNNQYLSRNGRPGRENKMCLAALEVAWSTEAQAPEAGLVLKLSVCDLMELGAHFDKLGGVAGWKSATGRQANRTLLGVEVTECARNEKVIGAAPAGKYFSAIGTCVGMP